MIRVLSFLLLLSVPGFAQKVLTDTSYVNPLIRSAASAAANALSVANAAASQAAANATAITTKQNAFTPGAGLTLNNNVLSSTATSSTGTSGTYAPSYAGNALIIYDGNSLWAGRGSSHEISSTTDFSAGPFPTTTRAALMAQFPSATFTSYNFGVSGQKTTDMISDASTQVDGQFNPALNDRQIIACGEITNHMADGGVSAQVAIDSYVSYCKARRAKGFLVVATTVLPRTTFFGSGMSAATFESQRQTVNSYIRLHYLEFADALADIASLNLTYPDGTHTNDAGYVQIGNLVASKIAPLLIQGFNPQSIAFLLSGSTSTANNTTTTSGTTTAGTSATGVALNLRGQGTNNSSTFTDEAGHVVTGFGNAKISTTQFKSPATSSISLDGSPGTYLTTASSSDFNLGTGDFTIELYLYKTGNGSGFPGVISRGDNAQNQWTLCFPNAGSRLELFVSGGSSYVAQGLNHSVDVPLNTWVHIALVSKDGVRKLYQNGILVGTASTNSNMEFNSTGKPLHIGYLPSLSNSGGDVLSGFINGLRVSKSALYLTSGFTPPTSF